MYIYHESVWLSHFVLRYANFWTIKLGVSRRYVSACRAMSLRSAPKGVVWDGPEIGMRRGRADVPRQAGKQHIYSYARGVNHRASISSWPVRARARAAGRGQTPMPVWRQKDSPAPRAPPRRAARGHRAPVPFLAVASECLIYAELLFSIGVALQLNNGRTYYWMKRNKKSIAIIRCAFTFKESQCSPSIIPCIILLTQYQNITLPWQSFQ